MKTCAGCGENVQEYETYGEITNDKTGKVIGVICELCGQSETMFKESIKRLLNQQKEYPT